MCYAFVVYITAVFDRVCAKKNRVLPRLAGIHVQGIRGYGVAGISGYGCILCILFIRCVFDRVCEKPG